MMCKSKFGLELDLDFSPIFIEIGLDLNILKCGGLDLTFFEMNLDGNRIIIPQVIFKVFFKRADLT